MPDTAASADRGSDRAQTSATALMAESYGSLFMLSAYPNDLEALEEATS